MKPAIFVQNNLVDANTKQVADFARAHSIELIDRSMSDAFNPDDCDVDWSEYGPILVYGSVEFIKVCAKSKHLAKYIFNDPTQFSMAACVERYKDLMLNAGGALMTAREILEDSGFAFDARLHIRPDSDDKAFNAKVFTYHGWVALTTDKKLDMDLQCWLSPVSKPILGEYRCWVVNGRVVSVVQYGVTGKLFTDVEFHSEARKFAEAHCVPDMPAKYYVMDICDTIDGFKIIEFNPINSSGWYGNVAKDVLTSWLTSMQQHAKYPRGMAFSEDMSWINYPV